MRKFWTLLCTASLLLSGITPVAFATVFPDVQEGHVYRESIESLVGAGVINGNPDCNFYPERAVNRAEMLKMLYRAKGKTPDPTSRDCFPDVQHGSWYESFVCDAASQRYIQGYSDGTFRPADLVNRVEAIKMITLVLDIPVAEITEEAREIIKFVDVSIAAWYSKYLYTAFSMGMLPIPGQTGAQFNPDWPLLRGEAAAYIFNALEAQLYAERQTASEEGEEGEDEQDTTLMEGTSEQGGGTTAQMLEATFPFSKSGKFTGKQSFSYTFDLARATVVTTEVALQSGQPGSVSCRLYRMQEDGFSHRYYLGYQDGERCSLRTALDAGSYQLQLQPTSSDTTYTVSSEETIGDGNDGFIQAVTLPIETTKTAMLTPNDFQDWYKFILTSETDMTVTVADSRQLRCIVYAMEDVDLYGFSGPACNQSYQYPPGTYYVAVGRETPRAATQTYTIQRR